MPKARCSKRDKINRHLKDPSRTFVYYDSKDVATNLTLPRRYTCIYRAGSSGVIISIGENYSGRLLESKHGKLDLHIGGVWEEIDDHLEIHMHALVSNKVQTNALLRNSIFCHKIPLILESIALAESELLKHNPELERAKIYVHFNSHVDQYDRIEYYHTLGYWM